MIINGIAAAAGIALAKCLFIKETCWKNYASERIAEHNKADEIDKFLCNRDCVLEKLEKIKENETIDHSSVKADVIEVHQMLLVDPTLVESVIEKIEKENHSALGAIQKAIEEQALIFEVSEDPYFRERALDIRDIGRSLINQILGVEETDLSNLNEDVILAAREILPSQLASTNASRVKGIISEAGGKTSHTVIIAKNMDIPAVTGVTKITDLLKDGETIAVNGFDGTIETQLSEEREKEINLIIEGGMKERILLKNLINKPAETKDGAAVKLFSNIIDAGGATQALEMGATGIGLFRTEFLFMERENAPTEEEQYRAYKDILEKMNGSPVTIRTLDIGGDKEIPYLNLPKETNPFLGYRAIRICLSDKKLFKTQLRAILRASVFGKAQIMYPMIASIEEVRDANAVLQEAKTELAKEGLEFDKDISVGIMIEIPSAAAIADILIKEVDFFSIGTNDLTQYLLAVDRINDKINKLYSYYHPGVLRVIAQVIQTVVRAGEDKKVCMCGEMAGDPVATVLLLGMGLKEFSMNPAAMLKIKQIVRLSDLSYAKLLAEDVLKMSSAEEIENFARKNYNKILLQ